MKSKFLFILLLLFAIVVLSYSLRYTPPTLLDVKVEEVKSYAYPIRSIDIQDTNYNDLSFLSAILKDNKIIFLGEQLHSDGATFEAKARLIRYLHEKLDYNVLLYEAGLYDMWLMNDQFYNNTLSVNFEEEQFPLLGLYSFWWNNDENKKLWDYFRKEKNNKNPMIFGGFDIQLTGEFYYGFRYKILDTYLKEKHITLDNYKAVSKNNGDIFSPYFNYQNHRQSFKDSLLIELDSISSILDRDNHKELKDEVYIRYLRGLRSRYESVWKYSSGSAQSMQKRDSLMADNLIWLVDSVYRDQKIIIWTANVHTFYQNPMEDIHFNSVGEYIKKKYKNESYMLTFTSYGQKNESGGLGDKASNKSIEYVFHKTHIPYFFIDIASLPENSFLRDSNISVINQRLNIKSDWSKQTDGIFHIDTMTYVKPW